MKIMFITGNKGKVAEISEIIPEVEMLDIDLPEIQDILAENIIKEKLVAASKVHKGRLMVEDTSLYLDCMNGLPGPLIKWFMKTIGNDGLYKLAISYENFGVTAEVIIGYMDESSKVYYFKGSLKGTVVEPRGENGFSWDPIFLPKGSDKTLGEMASEEKNSMSMRRIAADKLKEFID